MIIKKGEEHSHADDLEDILQLVRRDDMRLYPANCCLKVQAEKFIGFVLTRRGIEFNLEKCQAVIDMRIPTSMEEVHQLIGRLVALS